MATIDRADCYGLTRDELEQLVIEAGGMVAGTIEEAMPLLRSGCSVYLVTSDSADAAELKVRWRAGQLWHSSACCFPRPTSLVASQAQWRRVQAFPATSLRPDWLIHCLSRLTLLRTASYQHDRG